MKVKFISTKNNDFEEIDLPNRYYKYLWLLGQFIQHSLLYLQGIRIPEPPELRVRFPDKSPAELIDLHRDLYGCRFDWATGSLIVCYKDDRFEITTEAKKIVATTINPDRIACCSFDDRGFNFNQACGMAVDEIITCITSGKFKPI
ncbi:MAG: hypothetical protein ACTSRS_02650 [Candidatus Helarchaeota archaeon]